MGEFEFFRATENDRLWVTTPFAVSQDPWASFILNLFEDPEIVSGRGIRTFPHRVTPYSYSSTPRTFYLNRWETEPVDEIANGQFGQYYKYLYLPHVHRADLRVSNNGLIDAANPFYLDRLQARIEDAPRSATVLLEHLNDVHKGVLERLLGGLGKLTLDTRPPIGQTEELRRKMLEFAVEGEMLPSYYLKYGSPWDQDNIPLVGNYPASVHYILGKDELTYMTTIGFLRDLDVMIGRDTTLGVQEISRINRETHERYHHLVL
ncbi:MAG: hypothetical protein ABIH37_03205 [archaeon]